MNVVQSVHVRRSNDVVVVRSTTLEIIMVCYNPKSDEKKMIEVYVKMRTVRDGTMICNSRGQVGYVGVSGVRWGTSIIWKDRGRRSDQI